MQISLTSEKGYHDLSHYGDLEWTATITEGDTLKVEGFAYDPDVACRRAFRAYRKAKKLRKKYAKLRSQMGCTHD